MSNNTISVQEMPSSIKITPRKMSEDEVKLQNILRNLISTNELTQSCANKIADGMYPPQNNKNIPPAINSYQNIINKIISKKEEIKKPPPKEIDIYDGSIEWSDEHVCTDNCNHRYVRSANAHSDSP
jgi:hypothetical protein